MAANKTKEEKAILFDEILKDIAENNSPLRKALKGKLSPETFYRMLDDSETCTKQYARACKERADNIFEEMFEIADDGRNDYMTKVINGIEVEVINPEAIQRSRLRIDQRKWALSKMNPKKYGDKVDVTSGNEKINNNTPVNLKIDGKDITLK